MNNLDQQAKNKIYLWIIIILVVLNVSTISTVFFHKFEHRKKMDLMEKKHHLRRPPVFFKDRLQNNKNNFPEHHKLKHEFRIKARILSNKMDSMRIEVLEELSNENPDTVLLKNMANDFGEMHKNLKLLTIDLYLKMKSISTVEEQEELYHYFNYLLNKNKHHFKPRKEQKIKE